MDQMQYQTIIKFYDDASAMRNDIPRMEAQGWQVTGTETIKGDYTCFKTCCLGCIFLPLALLGKSNDKYKVEYKRDINFQSSYQGPILTDITYTKNGRIVN